MQLVFSCFMVWQFIFYYVIFGGIVLHKKCSLVDVTEFSRQKVTQGSLPALRKERSLLGFGLHVVLTDTKKQHKKKCVLPLLNSFNIS